MFDKAGDYEGSYLQQARLILDPDPRALRPSSFEAGENWLLWLEAHRGGGGPLSESASRATVYIELAEQPPVGVHIDLGATPLQVTYETGGQKIEYISRSATGTLLLEKGQGETLIASLDAAFVRPILGEGERKLSGRVELTPFEDF
jgi:hypothetical protein